MTTRAEAIQAAGRGLAVMRATVATMTPREQAEAAWTPTCGVTVDQLEDEIRVSRGLPLAHAS
ncbi:MAG: hypothetical protein JWM40_375 [Frankiales bacterium]|nr:hypothetical protein [Frankiales bacterium]